MKLEFLETSIVLERKHEIYKGSRRVKAHFFLSENGENVVIKSFNDEFHKLAKVKPVIITKTAFNDLPGDPEAKANRVLTMMGWK